MFSVIVLATGGVAAPEAAPFSIPPTVYIVGVAAAAATLLGVIGKAIFSWGKWVQRVNETRTTLNEFITEIRSDIKQILARIPATVSSPDYS